MLLRRHAVQPQPKTPGPYRGEWTPRRPVPTADFHTVSQRWQCVCAFVMRERRELLIHQTWPR